MAMGHEGGNRRGLANAVILAKKAAPFISRWPERYTELDDRPWNEHSVLLPERLSQEHLEEPCTLSPSVFFWPMWSRLAVDWLHKPLSPDEVDDVEAALRKNNGPLFPDQLAVHVWCRASRKYLDGLGPQAIRTENKPVDMMVRRFQDWEAKRRRRFALCCWAAASGQPQL